MTERDTSPTTPGEHRGIERVYVGSSALLAVAYLTGFATSVGLILALVTMSTAPAERTALVAIVCVAATWLFRRSVRRRDGGYPSDDPSVQPLAAWRIPEVRFRRRPLHTASKGAAVYSAIYFTLSGLGALFLSYGPAVPVTYAITLALTTALALLTRRRGPYVQVEQHLATTGSHPTSRTKESGRE